MIELKRFIISFTAIDYNNSYTMGNRSIRSNKKTKFTDNGIKGMLTSEGQVPQEMMARRENSFVKDVEDAVPGVPDVASVIEDLLEQSSKVFTANTDSYFSSVSLF